MSWQVVVLISIIVLALLADHAIANICKTFGRKDKS